VPVAIDTNVIIAALVSWHDQHERAVAVVENHLKRGDLVLPVPALVESYAVMTRLPAPHRLAPGDAFQVLHESFGDVQLAAVPTVGIWRTLREMAGASVSGGRSYDGWIVKAAIAAKATALLTFNVRDFDAFAHQIEIAAP
jgi:toxin FitB